jgi:deoxyribose-phosphate aldolase
MSTTANSKEIAKMLDHSLLHPTLTGKELRDGCAVAIRYNLATCCVKPCDTALTRDLLKGTDVKVCAVIGFPHGNSTLEIKLAETAQVLRDGATEVDMVINVARAIEGDWAFVEREIDAINGVSKKAGALLKVIFETDYLQDETIVRLCEICNRVGVGFVKTSTGYNFTKDTDGKYSYKGATLPVLALMRKHTGPKVQVKAAGACSTLDAVLKVREMGITRVGTGQSAKIVEDARVRLDGMKAATQSEAASTKGY